MELLPALVSTLSDRIKASNTRITKPFEKTVAINVVNMCRDWFDNKWHAFNWKEYAGYTKKHTFTLHKTVLDSFVSKGLLKKSGQVYFIEDQFKVAALQAAMELNK